MAQNDKNMTHSGGKPVASQRNDPQNPHYDPAELEENERLAPPAHEPVGPQETGAGEINRPGGTEPAPAGGDPVPSDETQSAPPRRSLV